MCVNEPESPERLSADRIIPKVRDKNPPCIPYDDMGDIT
jgi:hypothetical protein